MAANDHPRLTFENFTFDPSRLALYHGGELIRIERKALEVLAVLLDTPNELVCFDELIERVWRDNPAGVTPIHVAQPIAKLRKALQAYEPHSDFIENVRGQGYVFKGKVDYIGQTLVDRRSPDIPALTDDAASNLEGLRGSRGYRGQLIFLTVVVAVLLGGLVGWQLFRRDDEREIRRVLEESQRFESLVMYRFPNDFDQSKIDEYWLSEEQYGVDVDRRRINAGLSRLKAEDRHYGPESKCEQFEIQSVEVNTAGDFATAKTLEKWFTAEYQNDGTLIKNKTVGPYFVHYILLKVDGRWKVKVSSTARATPPPPIIENLAAVSEPTAGEEFYVRVDGQGFDAETFSMKVVGPGCPDVSPCSVPNSAIRIHSKISSSLIDKVPLTLASGEFTLYAVNGTSSPSNSTTLRVP
jgi:DNA-binding winged helix-turn-helix (wHTH) protein